MTYITYYQGASMSPFHVSEGFYIPECVEILYGRQGNALQLPHSIREQAAFAFNDFARQRLDNLRSHPSLHERVVSSYLLYKAKHISKKQLFPFRVVEEPGHVSTKNNSHRYYFIRLDMYIHERNNVREPGYHVEKKPGYIVNMPVVIGSNDQENEAEIARIFSLFHEQSFSSNVDKSKDKARTSLALVLGANRCKSLDPVRNDQFKRFITNFSTMEEFDVRMFGFFWEPKWKPLGAYKRDIPMKEVRKYFKVLQEIDPQLAEKIRIKHEEPKNGIRNRIPFQEIRETIKNSFSTMSATQRLRSYSQTRELYLAIMDPDCYQLRNDWNGLFSHYNEIVKNRNIVPSIMSTGYKAAYNAPPLIKLIIRLDQNARAAMLPYFPMAPYLPEPNLMIRIQEGAHTVHESFMDHKLSGKESRHIVKNVVNGRNLCPTQTVAFQTLGAIPTAIPNRFVNKKNGSWNQINYETIGRIDILKALRGKNCQSHIMPLMGWAYNLAQALSIRQFQQSEDTVKEINSALAEILKVVDPIGLTENFKMIYPNSDYNFYPVMDIYCLYYSSMSRIFAHLLEGDPTRNQFTYENTVVVTANSFTDAAALQIKEYSNVGRQKLHEFFMNNVSSLQNGYKKLIIKGLPTEEATRVVRAASAVGDSIYLTLKNYDYSQ